MQRNDNYRIIFSMKGLNGCICFLENLLYLAKSIVVTKLITLRLETRIVIKERIKRLLEINFECLYHYQELYT